MTEDVTEGAEQDNAPSVEVTPPRLFAKNVNILVSTGAADIDRTIEELIDHVRIALAPLVSSVTIMSSHYIIDGRVCSPGDYDPETKDRKPGTFPPPWAGGPTDAEVRKMNNVERTAASEGVTTPDEQSVVVNTAELVTALKETFVRPERTKETFVRPERTSVERNSSGRKVRADKGKPRGKRVVQKLRMQDEPAAMVDAE